jgi:uncharacterized membrane protein
MLVVVVVVVAVVAVLAVTGAVAAAAVARLLYFCSFSFCNCFSAMYLSYESTVKSPVFIENTLI